MTIYLAMTQPQLALLRAGGEIRLSTTDGSLAPPLADAVRELKTVDRRIYDAASVFFG